MTRPEGLKPEMDPRDLARWLAEIATTEAEELDCDDLAEMLEAIVAIAESGEDIRLVLPRVSVHLDHCPECRDLYQTLAALSPEID